MDSSLFYGGQQAYHLVSDLLVGNRGPEPVILRENLFIVSSNEDGSRRYTTKSLFDITLLFVAENIHRVDSLVDFPDPIGAKLFSVAHRINIFSIRDLAPTALQLFVDAYGEMVLKSLCLRNRAHLLVERTAEVKSFLSLTSLDLYGCKLGDEHEIFQHLTSPSLASLAQLFMGKNDISDAGLQRLSAPVRIMHRGLTCLQLLDISCNPISRKGLRYLTCLPKLVTLDVSGTNMKLSTGLKTTIWELLGLIYSEKPLDVFDHSRCKTDGWAEPVVHQWESLNMPEQKENKARFTALRNFGKLQSREAPSTEARTHKSEEVKTLHFHKAKHQLKDKLVSQSLQRKNTFDKKRKRETERCDYSPPIPQTGPVCSALTIEDMDLLSSY